MAVAGSTIAAVGPATAVRAAFPEAKVLDLGPCALLPGLVNCHAHLEYTLLKGWLDGLPFASWLYALVRASRRLSAEELFLSALWGAVECLHAGITCVADTTPSGASFAALRAAGLRGVVYQELFAAGAQDPAARVEEALARLASWPAGTHARLRRGLAPHAPYTAGTALLREAARAAEQHDLPLCLHLAEAVDEMALLPPGGSALRPEERGLDPVAYAASLGILGPRVLAAHCVQVDAQGAAVLAQAGVQVAHCPRSNARLGHGRAPLELWRQAGLAVGLGTDGAASGGSFDLLEEARAAVWLHRAACRRPDLLTAEEAVRLATLEGARALGLDKEIGSLEPGKQADLVAFDLTGLRAAASPNPYAGLLYHSGPPDVRLVMVGGEVLVREGRLVGVDEEELEREGRELARRLAAALP